MKPILDKGRACTRSLRFRLIILSVLVELVMLALMIGNNVRESTHHLTGLTQKRVEEMAETFSISLAPSLAARDLASLRSLVERLARLPDITYLLLQSDDGRALASSGQVPVPLPAPSPVVQDGQALYHAHVPVQLYGQTYGVLRYGLSLESLRQAEQALLVQGLIIGATEITLTILALSSIGFLLTRKLEDLTRASVRMAAGDYQTMVRIKGNDEVAALSAAFNAMADAVRQQILQLQINEANLRCSNQELGKLAEVTAHHLQEPLRRVTSYSQLLARHLQGRLDSDGRQFIDYVVNGATEMKKLLVDLQYYIAIDISPLPPDRLVDLGQCARAAQRELALLIEERQARLDIGPLPVMVGDAEQMQEVFVQVLRNALLHQKPDTPPCISIRANCDEAGTVISICDNGPGIDPDYAAQAFDLFCKLSTTGRGTGCGLAIVRKIIVRHGGRSWISRHQGAGQGTCVHFSLHDGRHVHYTSGHKR